MLAAGTPRSGSVPAVLPVTDLAMTRRDVATVVTVAQAASSLPAAQLLPGPVTTTTFGRSVVPVGKVASRVTEKLNVIEPPAAIDGIVQVRVSLANVRLVLQSPL